MILDGNTEVVLPCGRMYQIQNHGMVRQGTSGCTAVRVWRTAKSQGLGQVGDCEGVGVAAGQSESMS